MSSPRPIILVWGRRKRHWWRMWPAAVADMRELWGQRWWRRRGPRSGRKIPPDFC
ncbi:hypothetical protein PHJA_001410000 [Phtheirospermum japonicum]|uniref:Uncharacterized protein n=1 Tax=Phtheirospermum japonicum TaxID=374723 RepID=A0A830C6A6_9LAMI|nr:hypothetical protein PHJA_001410000 [Phtheirospermum japonicum]